MARALYGDPTLLILDEPNSNLDVEGEQALAAVVGGLKAAGVTLILISHRPSIMEKVDKVLVLKHGAQDLFGPRDAVLGELTNRIRKVAQMPRATPMVIKEVTETEVKEA